MFGYAWREIISSVKSEFLSRPTLDSSTGKLSQDALVQRSYPTEVNGALLPCSCQNSVASLRSA